MMIRREITVSGKVKDISDGISIYPENHRLGQNTYGIEVELKSDEVEDIVRDFLLNSGDNILSDLGYQRIDTIAKEQPKYMGVYDGNKILFCGKVISELGDEITYEPITDSDVLALTMPFLDDSFLLISGSEEQKKDTKKTNLKAIKKDGYDVRFNDEPALFLEDLKRNPYLVSTNLQNLNSDKDWILNSVPLS